MKWFLVFIGGEGFETDERKLVDSLVGIPSLKALEFKGCNVKGKMQSTL